MSRVSLSRLQPAQPAPDAGFSLLEVLVALVVVAFLAIAVGGLIAFTAELRSRTELAHRVTDSVAQLESVSNLLSDTAGTASQVQIANWSPTGLALVTAPKGPAQSITVHLIAASPRPAASLEVQYGGSSSMPTVVDLSAFETAAIDYLFVRGDALVWGQPESSGGAPVAARLMVGSGVRRWSILLWVVPRGQMPDLHHG